MQSATLHVVARTFLLVLKPYLQAAQAKAQKNAGAAIVDIESVECCAVLDDATERLAFLFAN